MEIETDSAQAFTCVTCIGRGYASAVYDEKLVVVDLRRAEESVAYHNYISMLKNGSSVTERLLFAEKMVLSIDDFSLLQETHGEFIRMGFDIKFLDNHAIEICGVPSDARLESIDEMIYEMLDTIRDSVLSPADLRREKLATIMARNAARGSAGTYNAEQAAAILSALAASENIRYTPSGKAVMTEIGFEEIKNRLK